MRIEYPTGNLGHGLTRMLYTLGMMEPYLFPNLKTLTVKRATHRVLEDLTPVLAAPLQNLILEVEIEDDYVAWAGDNVQLFFATLAEDTAHHLRTIDIQWVTPSDMDDFEQMVTEDCLGFPVQYRINDALRHCMNLVKVSIDVDHTFFIQGLASLPQLNDLEIRFIHSTYTPPAEDGPPNPFPALETLRLVCQYASLDYANTLLSGCCCFARKSITVFVSKDYGCRTEEITAIVSTLIHPLVSLQLEIFRFECVHVRTPVGPPRFPFTKCMGGLLKLHMLKSIEVACDNPVMVTDSELDQISRAWPVLEELILETGIHGCNLNIPRFVPVATLDGLGYLARCTHLRRLQLLFQARLKTARPFFDLVPCRSLKTLVVGMSPIAANHETRVVDFLTEFFPNLSHVHCLADPEDMMSVEIKSAEDKITSRWWKVEKIRRARRSLNVPGVTS